MSRRSLLLCDASRLCADENEYWLARVSNVMGIIVAVPVLFSLVLILSLTHRYLLLVLPSLVDIRDVDDQWVRMHAKAGDFVEFPKGIEHRFSVDDTGYIQGRWCVCAR